MDLTMMAGSGTRPEASPSPAEPHFLESTLPLDNYGPSAHPLPHFNSRLIQNEPLTEMRDADIEAAIAKAAIVRTADLANHLHPERQWPQHPITSYSKTGNSSRQNVGIQNSARPEQQEPKFTNRLVLDRKPRDASEVRHHQGLLAGGIPNDLLDPTASPISSTTSKAQGLLEAAVYTSCSNTPVTSVNSAKTPSSSSLHSVAHPRNGRHPSGSIQIHRGDESAPLESHRLQEQGKQYVDTVASRHPDSSSAQMSQHGSFGNRISTFFGQHRPMPAALRTRPATSQGLLEPSNVAYSDDGRAGKRTLFGIPQSRARQTPQAPAHPSRNFQEEYRPSVSQHKIDELGHPSSSNQHVTHLVEKFLGDGGQITRFVAGPSSLRREHSTPSSTVPVSECQEKSMNRSQSDRGNHNIQLPIADPAVSNLTQRSSAIGNDGGAHGTIPSSSSNNDRSIDTPVSGWNRWTTPSDMTRGIYAESKEERKRQFSWEVNPSLSDGRELMGFGGDLGKKRLYVAGQSTGPSSSADLVTGRSDDSSDKPQLPYIIGFEKHVLAFEPLIQDAFYALAGNKHTFYPADSPPPKRVLDIGTGTGAWPIAMAQEWRDTTFVGLDVASIQTDLQALAKAVHILQEDSADLSEIAPRIDWQNLADRITWRIGDFLQELPFDTGSFDMVHIRFVGLGVPESSWSDLLSEASRVLKRDTGVMEIVEMSKILPSATPHSLRASFASLMLSNFIHQYPFIPIRPALAMSGFAVSEVFKSVIRRSGIRSDDPPNVLLQAMGIWVDSALGKGKHGRGRGMSGDAYGSLGGKTPSAATGTTPRWGEGVMGQHALTQLRQHGLSEHQLATETAEDMRDFGEDYLPPAERPSSRWSKGSSDPSGDDDVNLVGWIARKR